MALNNDQSNTYQRTVQTSFGPNVQLQEYTGKHPDIWTDQQGRATFTIPRNVNGQSYLCFSHTGYSQPFSLNQRQTTQTFSGAPDLDIGPVTNKTSVTAGRIWCQQGTAISAILTPDAADWQAGAAILVEVVDANGKVVGSTRQTSPSAAHLTAKADGSGWFALRLTGSDLLQPAAYALTVTYTGTQELAP